MSRSFPCLNCVDAEVPCVQPTVTQRRRRVAERELLDRLRHYEDLLRRNNIPFEPLHGSVEGSSAVTPRDAGGDKEQEMYGYLLMMMRRSSCVELTFPLQNRPADKQTSGKLSPAVHPALNNTS